MMDVDGIRWARTLYNPQILLFVGEPIRTTEQPMQCLTAVALLSGHISSLNRVFGLLPHHASQLIQGKV